MPRKPKANTSCIIYARYSSVGQNPLSCANQIAACREYAADQGWRVVAEFQDTATSGTLGRKDRVGWDALLRYIVDKDLGAGSVVLAWDWDRWSRHKYQGPIARMQIQDLGVDVADTTSGKFGTDFAGQVLATIKEQGAAEFSEKLSRRVTDGLRVKREAGYWTCAPPYGFEGEQTPGGTILTPHPNQADIVRQMFAWAAHGFTSAVIARRLNHNGTPAPKGTMWRTQTVRRMLINPAYVGKVVQFGPRGRAPGAVPEMWEIYEGKHDGIVDRAVFDLVAELYRPDRQQKNPPRMYPLSGLIICGECGRRAIIVGAHKWRAYRCRPYGAETGCGSRRLVQAAHLEDAAKTWAQELGTNKKALELAGRELAAAEWEQARRRSEDRAPIEAEIAELNRKQARLLEAIYAGNAPSVINDELRQIEIALADRQAALEAVGTSIEPIPQAVAVAAVREALERGASDLRALRPLIDEIILPANDSPPEMRIMGQVVPLSVPLQRRRS